MTLIKMKIMVAKNFEQFDQTRQNKSGEQESKVYDEEDGIFEVLEPKDPVIVAFDEENREKFMERLKDFRENDIKTINFAYDLAKEAHRPQTRDSGERYFEHVRNVSIILMDECGIDDPNLIISALLHDSGEDSPIFGNRNNSYDDWKATTEYRLSKIFNPIVADNVVALTKPSEANFPNKEDGHHFYIENLKVAGSDVIMAKMCDRLHNLRSLKGNRPEKIAKQLRETREIYFPVFKLAKEKYPQQTEYMLSQMEKAMNEVDPEFKS